MAGSRSGSEASSAILTFEGLRMGEVIDYRSSYSYGMSHDIKKLLLQMNYIS
jgi:hypothetical protein